MLPRPPHLKWEYISGFNFNTKTTRKSSPGIHLAFAAARQVPSHSHPTSLHFTCNSWHYRKWQYRGKHAYACNMSSIRVTFGEHLATATTKLEPWILEKFNDGDVATQGSLSHIHKPSRNWPQSRAQRLQVKKRLQNTDQSTPGSFAEETLQCRCVNLCAESPRSPLRTVILEELASHHPTSTQ